MRLRRAIVVVENAFAELFEQPDDGWRYLQLLAANHELAHTTQRNGILTELLCQLLQDNYRKMKSFNLILLDKFAELRNIHARCIRQQHHGAARCQSRENFLKAHV